MPDTQPTADFFRQLELERTRALVRQDMKRCWALHAANYMLISPPGRTWTREGYLGLIETGTLKYLRWEPEDIEVRISPRMAIVRYRVTFELGSRDGEPSTPFACWHTDSYELNPEGWQAVWSQATRIVS